MSLSHSMLVEAGESALATVRATRVRVWGTRAWCGATRGDSTALIAHALTLCGRFGLSGASDSDLPILTSVLRGASLCTDCLARKSGSPRGTIAAAMGMIAKTVKVTTSVARCDGCLALETVYRLG